MNKRIQHVEQLLGMTVIDGAHAPYIDLFGAENAAQAEVAIVNREYAGQFYEVGELDGDRHIAV
jgi:hypothetical protein